MNSVPRAVQLMEIGAANATDASSPSCRLRASRWASRNGLSSRPPPDCENLWVERHLAVRQSGEQQHK